MMYQLGIKTNQNTNMVENMYTHACESTNPGVTHRAPIKKKDSDAGKEKCSSVRHFADKNEKPEIGENALLSDGCVHNLVNR